MIPPFAYRQAAVTAQAASINGIKGKRSVRLNLEMREAVAIAKSLAVHCDLVVENFAPGVIARMGLGYKDLRGIRPEIIMLHCPKCQGLARTEWPRESPRPGVARATTERRTGLGVDYRQDR